MVCIRLIHPKLRSINLHNITQSLISRNPRKRMFKVQISLLNCHISLSLISRITSVTQSTKEVNPHPRMAPCVNMWSVTFFFFFLCHLLNVSACTTTTCVMWQRTMQLSQVTATKIMPCIIYGEQFFLREGGDSM